jgi:hypothetical protein
MRATPRTGIWACGAAMVAMLLAAPAAPAAHPPPSVAIAYVGQKIPGGITITKLDRLLATGHGSAAFTAFLSGGRYGIFWSVVQGGKRKLHRLAIYSFTGFYPNVVRLLATDQTGGQLVFPLDCHLYLADRRKPEPPADLGDACYKQEANYPKRTVTPNGFGGDFDVDLSGFVYFPARDSLDPGPPEQPRNDSYVERLSKSNQIPTPFALANLDDYVQVGPNGDVFLTDHHAIFQVGSGDPVPIMGEGTSFTLPSPGTISTYTFGANGAMVCAFDGPRFFHYPGNPRFLTLHLNSTRGVECGESPDLVAVSLGDFGGPHSRLDKITNRTKKGVLKEGERVGFAKAVYKLRNLYSDHFSTPFAYDGTIAFHGVVNNAKHTEAFMVREP